MALSRLRIVYIAREYLQKPETTKKRYLKHTYLTFICFPQFYDERSLFVLFRRMRDSTIPHIMEVLLLFLHLFRFEHMLSIECVFFYHYCFWAFSIFSADRCKKIKVFFSSQVSSSECDTIMKPVCKYLLSLIVWTGDECTSTAVRM